MTDIPEVFITFPTSDQISLAVGTTSIDFIEGIARLVDNTEISLARKISQTKPCKSIFFEVDNDINIKLAYQSEIQFSGRIPAGTFEIPDITFDSCDIITSVITDTYVIASTSNKPSG